MAAPPPRLYSDPHLQGGPDLSAIQNLVRAGRKAMQAGSPTYFTHPGDMTWWLFYPPLVESQVSKVYLWDDPERVGEILGLVFISDHEYTAFLHPEAPVEQQTAMRAWAEQACMARARKAGKERIFSGFISDRDAYWRHWYEQQGYVVEQDSDYACFIHDLKYIPLAMLPEGFTFAHIGKDDLIPSRAKAQYDAFHSGAPWEDYLQRYQRFAHSPAYTPELDRVVLSPEGQVAAFCINWLDVETGVALFEPVGTHPDFLRRGLGKALLCHALHAIREAGMHQAIVLTNWNNEPAIGLYHAAGFQDNGHLLLFGKPVEHGGE